MYYVTKEEFEDVLSMDIQDKKKYLIENCGVKEIDLILDFLIYYDINGYLESRIRQHVKVRSKL